MNPRDFPNRVLDDMHKALKRRSKSKDAGYMRPIPHIFPDDEGYDILDWRL